MAVLTGFPRLYDLLHSANPPDLDDVRRILRGAQYYQSFINAVHNLFPDQEQEILKETPGDTRKIAKVFDLVERVYKLEFNRDVADEEFQEVGWEMFEGEVPIYTPGFAYEDYHQLSDVGEDMVYYAALVRSPWFGDESGIQDYREALAELVGKDLVAKLPVTGLAIEEIEEMLKGSRKYSCVIDLLHWMTGDTKSAFGTFNYETYEGNDISWGSKEKIAWAGKDWQLWLKENARISQARKLLCPGIVDPASREEAIRVMREPMTGLVGFLVDKMAKLGKDNRPRKRGKTNDLGPGKYPEERTEDDDDDHDED